MIVTVDDTLVEQAVVGAAKGLLARRLMAEREKPYRIDDPEERERAFNSLYRRWFGALELDRPLTESLARYPEVDRAVAACTVVPAMRRADEGAELFVRPSDGGSGPEDRRLVIRMRWETLVDPAAVRALIDRELVHVAEMLDPSFGYQPGLGREPCGQTADRLLLDRYAAVWGASVAGRLTRQGRAPPSEREAALARFVAAFPMLAEDPEPSFSRFWDGRPTHREMVEFARSPRGLASGNGPEPGSRCPLCAMPSYHFAECVEGRVAEAIALDFPDWHPDAGACVQCAEIYRTRSGVRVTEMPPSDARPAGWRIAKRSRGKRPLSL